MKQRFMGSVAMASLVAFLGTGCSSKAQLGGTSELQEHAHHAGTTSQPAAVHGMVLFGKDQLFASHIPMFSVPHDWQALLAVEMTHPTIDARALYLSQAFSGNEQGYFTLKPKPFVLPRLLSGELTSFEASLYKGSFEDGGVELLQGVTIRVSKVLISKHLHTDTPALQQLTYMTGPGSNYVTHVISAPANFDQILQVEWTTPPGASLPSAQSLAPLKFSAQDSQATRLKKGDHFAVRLLNGAWVAQPQAPEVPSQNQGIGLKIVADFYCTPGPDFFGTCN